MWINTEERKVPEIKILAEIGKLILTFTQMCKGFRTVKTFFKKPKLTNLHYLILRFLAKSFK